ncbi:MAG: ROK family protein [Propionibacteriaceae bacterium]|jgi:predicted NBD/HSP70 family sugar kinase|nr:ROK family protein [Propionibacteriaceae bacterium]
MFLGIDIGATKAHGVAIDENLTVLAEDATFTRTGEEGVTSVLLEIAGNVAEKAGVEPHDFTSVGVGIPGVVNRETGEVTSAVNLRVEHLKLASIVESCFSAPVRVDNDVKAAVVGAARLLGSDSVTYLNLGTGLAAATIQGDLIRGFGNAAGEIGHLVMDPRGDPCRCGQRGCLETVIGGRYLAPRMAQLELDWSTLADNPRLDARAALDQVVRVTAQTVSLLALAYDSENIVLGGGVVQAAPWLLGSVQDFFLLRAPTATFPDYADMARRMRTLPEDSRVSAIGAALMGQERIA